MKVGIIKFNSFNHKQLSNNSHNNQCVSSNKHLMNLPIKDSLEFSPIKKSQISFESSRLPFDKMTNIPCPCCGKIMVPIAIFSEKLTEKALSGSSKKAISVLSQFENNMPTTEKLCFRKIKDYSERSPHKTLNEIVTTLRIKSKRFLNESQFKTLRQIDNLGQDLSAESMKKLKDFTDRARFIITADQPGYFFKRKTFIKKLAQLIEEMPEKEIGENIYKKSLKLNTSENDVNAFIVKYSQRSSSEIGQRLVSKAISTIEHIKPQAYEGENHFRNYILECAGCNNSRNETPLDEWI